MQGYLEPRAPGIEGYAHLCYLWDVWSVVTKAWALPSLVSFDPALSMVPLPQDETEPLLEAGKDGVSKSTHPAPCPGP